MQAATLRAVLAAPLPLLLIEDDAKLAHYTQAFLAQSGLPTEVARDGESALAALERRRFALILLDLTLPGIDGLDLARAIRARCQTPIIMVTARAEDDDKIIGLELGADDYLTKPFNPRELLARARALLRRTHAAPECLRVGALTLRPASREALRAGQPLALTSQEFDLLLCLARNAGRVSSREVLLEQLKGSAADTVFDRSIDVIVSRLRQKLGDDPRRPCFIKTVRSAGYLLSLEEEDHGSR